jgi:hypothetical protein
LLDRFLDLRGADDEKIAAFVRRWGILGICEHGLPRTHHLARIAPRSLEDGPAGCLPLGFDFGKGGCLGREPIADWRTWAQAANDIVALATAAHHNLRGNQAAWDRLTEGREPQGPSGRRLRQIVAKGVQWWLELGGVRPQFSWIADVGVQITLGSRGTWDPLPQRPTRLYGHQHGATLFGALAAQLMVRVADVEGLAICSACGMPYLPTRRPAPNRRNYCSSCRAAGVPLRDALRAHRLRHPRSRRRS